MKKYVISAISVIAVLSLIYAALPFVAVYKIREAYKEKNADEFSKYVDFEAVRKNIRTQIVMEMVEKEFKGDEDPQTRAFAISFAEGIMGAFLDAFITPTFVMVLFDSGEKSGNKEVAATDYSQESAAAASNQNDSSGKKESVEIAKKSQENPFDKTKYGFESLNKFHVILVNKKDSSEIKIILVRKGVDWKISEIAFPKGFFEGKL